jgi:hypothetical protein
MARRKPRKNAGPQPHHGPRKARREGGSATASTNAAAPKRRPGEPHPPSFKGVAIRAAIVSALFYPYLIYVAGHSVAAALIVTGVAFLFMLPLGLLMDRFRYKRQMARWMEKRDKTAAPKPAKP